MGGGGGTLGGLQSNPYQGQWGGSPPQMPQNQTAKQIQSVGGSQNVNQYGKAYGWNPTATQPQQKPYFTGGTPLLGSPYQSGGNDYMQALQRMFGGMGGGGGYGFNNLMY